MTVASNDALLAAVRARAGADAVRPAAEADAIDGVRPRLVAEPATADAVAAVLAWAFGETRAVTVVGGGTKLAWGAPSGPIDVRLSTAGLRRVVEHRHGDLTATVEAGAPLAAVNASLAAHRQWLPWDPPWSAQATIGGVVATNDSGPRRHGFGVPRDSIIGVTFARPDGTVAKAGGIVVKNVAGYDLSRLMTGSFGCLGVVLSATFKLAPAPPASSTVEVRMDSLEAAAPVVAALAESTLTPSALELASGHGGTRVLVRFESVEEAARQQAREASVLVRAHGSPVVASGADEAALWDRHAAHWAPGGTLVKLSCLPTALIPTLVWMRDSAQARGVALAVAGRAGLGVVDVHLTGALDAQARLVVELRERLPAGDGSAVVRRGDAALRRHVDAWGAIGDAIGVMRSIKQRFDPAGILNAGRGPGGI